MRLHMPQVTVPLNSVQFVGEDLSISGGLSGENRGWQVLQGTVRPDVVVVGSPLFNRVAGVEPITEPMLVETLIPELAVEAFDECVLCRFARLDEVQLHAVILRPEEQCLAGELRAVVHIEA